MLQHEKLPFTQPPSPAPETTNERSTNLHRYFVLATFVAYFTLDFVTNILATRRYVSSFSDFLYLFAGDIVAAVTFSKYALLEKTPRYNRLLSYYFVAVGFLYPLAVGASILVERAQGNDPHLYFGHGYEGTQITYCSVRTFNSGSTPQTLRKIIVFLALVCLAMDIVIATTKPVMYAILGHGFGIFLPDLLTIIMFSKYVRNGLGRYPPKTRFILFTLLLTASLMWPVLTFVDAGVVYTENGQYWMAYDLSRYDVFFCTAGFNILVDPDVAAFVHVVRSRDILCLLYLCLAAIELIRSLRLFKTTTAVDVEKAGDAKAGQGADGEEDIEMAPSDQKMDEDKDFKNEYEAEAEEDVGK
ncbi:hypothetical protein BGZ82_004630 [Podila clonocystis]|nr:hypothetical protein BGZ82_004630 [Podila clonocystis]